MTPSASCKRVCVCTRRCRIVSAAGETLTLTVQAPGQPIALRLHWLDSPCCKSFYGNDPNYSWQWWGVAQHPVPDAGVCRESAPACTAEAFA